MNKERIKETLLNMQRNLVAEFNDKVNTIHTMVDLDEDDTIDSEDFSHQYESKEMEQLMKVQLNKAKRSIDVLESIDFSPKSRVEAGAIVVTDRLNFFVGFAVTPFDIDGMHVVGISKASPLYSCILGKKEGDRFNYCGVEYSIEKIY